MRIPLPRRINIKYMALIAIALMMIQIFEGTEPLFAFLGAVFLMIWAASFNACDGFTYPSGGWVAFYGIGTGVIGLFWKAIIFEPADKNLINPDKTMLLYCAGMLMIGLSAFAGHRVSYKKGLLSDYVAGEEMKTAAIGCFLVGTAFELVFRNVDTTGSVASAIRQFNQFNRMAIIMATYYEVKSSGGTRSFNWIIGASGAVLFTEGLVGFSKEALFIPFLVWLLPAIAAGMIITKKQIIGGMAVAFFLVFYMVPYSQYGRQSRTDIYDFDTAVATVERYLFHLEETRELFNEIDSSVDQTTVNHYYDRPQGLADREQMLSPDDALIDTTDTIGTYGIYPTVFGYLNIIPHVVWPSKPVLVVGNLYAHELGILSDDDETTGISFSPAADTYHQLGWIGVFTLLPLIVFIYCFLNDSVTGSVFVAPWALLAFAQASNAGPQGGVSGTIYLSTLGVFNIIIVAALSKYVLAPVLKLVTGGKGKGASGEDQAGGSSSFDPRGLPANGGASV